MNLPTGISLRVTVCFKTCLSVFFSPRVRRHIRASKQDPCARETTRSSVAISQTANPTPSPAWSQRPRRRPEALQQSKRDCQMCALLAPCVIFSLVIFCSLCFFLDFFCGRAHCHRWKNHKTFPPNKKHLSLQQIFQCFCLCVACAFLCFGFALDITNSVGIYLSVRSIFLLAF